MHGNAEGVELLKQHIDADLDGGYEASVHDYTDFKVTQTEKEVKK